jgi:hypothetical protein
MNINNPILEMRRLRLGRSMVGFMPQFPEFRVSINMDHFHPMHALKCLTNKIKIPLPKFESPPCDHTFPCSDLYSSLQTTYCNAVHQILVALSAFRHEGLFPLKQRVAV